MRFRGINSNHWFHNTASTSSIRTLSRMAYNIYFWLAMYLNNLYSSILTNLKKKLTLSARKRQIGDVVQHDLSDSRLEVCPSDPVGAFPIHVHILVLDGYTIVVRFAGNGGFAISLFPDVCQIHKLYSLFIWIKFAHRLGTRVPNLDHLPLLDPDRWATWGKRDRGVKSPGYVIDSSGLIKRLN